MDVNGKQWYPSQGEVNIIYENTATGSPARRLMVDFHVKWGGPDWIGETEDGEKLNYDFLIDVSKALLSECDVMEDNEFKYNVLEDGPPCKYHNHGDDKPCPTTRCECLG